MTTTPKPTAEEVIHLALHNHKGRPNPVNERTAAYVADELRYFGLLGGDHEEHQHRPEPVQAYALSDCANCNCEHESECPVREILICVECTRIAETAAPGWLERTFDFSLVKWPCAAQPVLEQGDYLEGLEEGIKIGHAERKLDPEKVAEVYAHADADWQFEWDKFRSETGADPGPNADYVARAICEAAKRGELSA